MKRLITLTLMLLLTVGASAQVDIKNEPAVDYYGIDFSLVKVYGAKETKHQFMSVFNRINELVIHEYAKYNVGKYFQKDDVEPMLEVTVAINDAIDPDSILTYRRTYKFTPEQIQQHINNYKIMPKHRLGMVIMAELLNKETYMGSYHVVFFDTQTKQILMSKHVKGKAYGMGLRNYWAGSIYDIMKRWSYNQSNVASMRDDLY